MQNNPNQSSMSYSILNPEELINPGAWMADHWPNARKLDVNWTMERYDYPAEVREWIMSSPDWRLVSTENGGTYERVSVGINETELSEPPLSPINIEVPPHMPPAPPLITAIEIPHEDGLVDAQVALPQTPPAPRPQHNTQMSHLPANITTKLNEGKYSSLLHKMENNTDQTKKNNGATTMVPENTSQKDNISGFRKSSAEDEEKSKTFAQNYKETPYAAAMDDANKEALNVWAEQGVSAAVKHMFTRPESEGGGTMSYAEMRSRYG